MYVDHLPAPPHTRFHIMQGRKIINATGVPGTFGCIGWMIMESRPVILSNWHVLFGNGALKNDLIWLAVKKAVVRAWRKPVEFFPGRSAL